MWGFLHYVRVLTMHFWAIFTHKMAITEWKTTISEIKFKFILKTTCKKLFKMPGQCQVSFTVLGFQKWPFRAIFLLNKMAITWVQMITLEKKITLVLKTTYKKVFLQYQVNLWFASMCLASKNAIFSGGRRRKNTKKVGQSIGDPIRWRDAPITKKKIFTTVHVSTWREVTCLSWRFAKLISKLGFTPPTGTVNYTLNIYHDVYPKQSRRGGNNVRRKFLF